MGAIMGLMIMTMHTVDSFIPQFICPTLRPIDGSFQESSFLIPWPVELKSWHRNTSKGSNENNLNVQQLGVI